MKTAIEKLIETLEQQKQILNDHFVAGELNGVRRNEIGICIGMAKAMLPIEKQQIVDAYNAGQYNGYPSDQNNNNDEDYYKTTFNK